MKKIIAGIILASVVAMGFAAKNKIKDHVTETKMGKYDDVEIGSGTLRYKALLKQELQAAEVSVMLYPKRGLVGIEFKKGIGHKERVLFDADARKALKEAYEQYIDDYENKKLDKKKTKYERKYGYARVKTEWGPFQYSSYAEPKASFGYIFVGKSPYFALKIPQTKSDQKKGDVVVEYADSLFYFTRSQIKEIVDAMTEEKIGEAIDSLRIDLPTADEYEEADDEASDASKAESEEAGYEEAE